MQPGNISTYSMDGVFTFLAQYPLKMVVWCEVRNVFIFVVGLHFRSFFLLIALTGWLACVHHLSLIYLQNSEHLLKMHFVIEVPSRNFRIKAGDKCFTLSLIISLWTRFNFLKPMSMPTTKKTEFWDSSEEKKKISMEDVDSFLVRLIITRRFFPWFVSLMDDTVVKLWVW